MASDGSVRFRNREEHSKERKRAAHEDSQFGEWKGGYSERKNPPSLFPLNCSGAGRKGKRESLLEKRGSGPDDPSTSLFLHDARPGKGGIKGALARGTGRLLFGFLVLA